MGLPLLYAAAAAAPVVTGLLGANESRSAADRAARAQQAQLDRLLAIELPDIEKMKLSPEELLSAGQISPEEYQLLGTLQGTELESISTDPRLRQDQTTALDLTRQRALTGFNDEDRATLDQYMRQMTSAAQAQKQGIVEDAARRGMAGSGTSLAAALSGSQGIANQASQQAMQAASARVQNQSNNANLLAQLSGQLENTDYSRQANIANRKDMVNEFNARLRQDTGNMNVGARNQAQQANLANRQALMNANTGNRNDAQRYNRGLQQTRFNNEMAKVTGAQPVTNNLTDIYNNQGQAAANAYAGIGTGIAGAIGSYAMGKKDDAKVAAMDRLSNAYESRNSAASNGYSLGNFNFGDK